MIKVLMLDLGETLVRGQQVLPHVREALTALSRSETAAGAPLEMCLVSDFDMPVPPPTPTKIKTIFRRYTTLVAGFDLARFFQPAARRMTISAHAGALKPDRRVFETAIRRLGVTAALTECLFITEHAGHIAKCRELGMATLQFGVDFSDWSEGPLLVARALAAGNARNLQAALALRLSAAHELELLSLTDVTAQRVRAVANQLRPLPPPGAPQPVRVPVPVELEIKLDERGRIKSLVVGEPDAAALTEAAAYLETLQAQQQVTEQPGPLPPGVTHRIETDEQGRKRLRRGRFSLR